MMTMAKAITSGYFPLSATLIGEAIAEAFETDATTFGSIGHGYTYSGHPVGCAAGIAALAETAASSSTKTPPRAATMSRRRWLRSRSSTRWSAMSKARSDGRARVGRRSRDGKKPADKKAMAKVAGRCLRGRRDAAHLRQQSDPDSAPDRSPRADVRRIAEGIDAGLSAAS